MRMASKLKRNLLFLDVAIFLVLISTDKWAYLPTTLVFVLLILLPLLAVYLIYDMTRPTS